MQMSPSLVWQIIRGSNAFLKTGLNGHVFSTEKGNLYNKHSFKYSGIANQKTVDVSLDSADAVVASYGRTKTAHQPKKSKNVQVVKQNARKALITIAKQAGSVRPDLKNAARSRAAALHKSLRAKKAPAKK